jgi:taspase (threonine aspartase 1)
MFIIGTLMTFLYLGHPGVKESHCQGAIGIMAVKKTIDGVYLCFGHNTDSFVGRPCLSNSSLFC